MCVRRHDRFFAIMQDEPFRDRDGIGNWHGIVASWCVGHKCVLLTSLRRKPKRKDREGLVPNRNSIG